MNNKTPYKHLIDTMLTKYRESGLPQVSLDNVHIEMSNRFRTKGGVCACNRMLKRVRITLNAELFSRIDDAAKMDIIIHEFAHGIEFLAYGNLSHSGTWCRIAQTLGGTGETKHELEVKHNKVRRIIMATSTGSIYVLTVQQAKKFGVTAYCTKTYIGEIEVDRDTNTYRWTCLKVEGLREHRLLREHFKLVA